MPKENPMILQATTQCCSRGLTFIGVLLTIFGCFGNDAHAEQLRNWPTVSKGEVDETNVRVEMVQWLLRSHGYHVTIDGHYGNQTQYLVQHFQKSNHLKITGAVDRITWRKLIVILAPGSNGASVYAAQIPLKEMADGRLSLNGRFDIQTACAVRIFQRQYGLKANGVVGTATWLCLTNNIYD